MKKEKADIKPAPVKKKGPWMYVGPTIPGVAVKMDMYADKIPKELESKAKEIGAINELIIPIEKAVGIEKQLESGRLKNMYDSVVKKLRKENK